MNGNEAINLTTEVNAICKTDYMSTLKQHECPNRPAKMPEHAPCCSKRKNQRIVHVTIRMFLDKSSSSSSSTATTPKPITTTTTMTEAPKMDEKQLVAAMEAAAQNMARNEQAMASAAAAARRLNMDRFMRLSRKPTDMTIRGFSRMEGGAHQVHSPTL